MFEIAAVISFMLGTVITIGLDLGYFISEHNNNAFTASEKFALKGIIAVIILFTILFILMGVSILKGLF